MALRSVLRLILTILTLHYVAPIIAQMSFSFNDIDINTKQLADGSTLIEFPLSVDLGTVMSNAMVFIDGKQIEKPQEIIPDPTTLSLKDNEIVVFLYRGEAYQFLFSLGHYFTAVFLSDPHIEHSGHDATSISDMQTYAERIIDLGKKEEGARLRFSSFPEYIPTCDIVFSLGDMDGDSKTSQEEFNIAHSAFNESGIPFITLCGNHDLVPDYWTGEDPDYGLTAGTSGGSKCNDVALSTVMAYLDTAQTNGITDLQVINDGTNHTQANPFTFTFNGVRFYCGQTYWFQKPYSGSWLTLGSLVLSKATYYAPDGIIDALETFVDNHSDEPSVWMQHYPFSAGSDCDRWWLDQNDYGLYLKTSDESQYGTFDDVEIYTSASAKAIAKTKKDKLASIINKTFNPVHFSGHTHVFSTNTYNDITDYTCAASGYTAGAAYVVLLKGNKGVIEVQELQFNDECMSGIDNIEMLELNTDSGNCQRTTLANLTKALNNLSTKSFSEETTQAKAITTQAEVDDALEIEDRAFQNWIAQQEGDYADVTALLGSNTDFESTQEDALENNINVHPQIGWNEHMSWFSTDYNAQYIHLRQRDDDGSPTNNSLFIRAKWADHTGHDQIIKQVALPSGTYTLSFYIKRAGTLTENLCYYALDGIKNTISATTSWQTITETFTCNKPTTFTLSFGFTGGKGDVESAISVDDITLKCAIPTYSNVSEIENSPKYKLTLVQNKLILYALKPATIFISSPSGVIEHKITIKKGQQKSVILSKGIHIIDNKKILIV